MRLMLKAAIVVAALPLSGAVVAQAARDAVAEDFIQSVQDLDNPGRPAGATRGFSLGAPTGRDSARPSNPSARAGKAKQSRSAVKAAVAKQGGVDLALTFGYNSDKLTPAAQVRAKSIAHALNDARLAAMRFRIEGHTDASGSAAYNLALSERRANTVADFLVREGVSRDRLEVEGYGFQRLLSGVPPKSAQNRRVQAVRLSNG